MKSAALLQDIFDREIARLNELSKEAPLDMADIVRLEKVVAAYSKFRAQDLKDEAGLDHLPTDELLKQVKK